MWAIQYFALVRVPSYKSITDRVYLFLRRFFRRRFRHAVQKAPPRVEFLRHEMLLACACKKEGDTGGKNCQ